MRTPPTSASSGGPRDRLRQLDPRRRGGRPLGHAAAWNAHLARIPRRSTPRSTSGRATWTRSARGGSPTAPSSCTGTATVPTSRVDSVDEDDLEEPATDRACLRGARAARGAPDARRCSRAIALAARSVSSTSSSRAGDAARRVRARIAHLGHELDGRDDGRGTRARGVARRECDARRGRRRRGRPASRSTARDAQSSARGARAGRGAARARRARVPLDAAAQREHVRDEALRLREEPVAPTEPGPW